MARIYGKVETPARISVRSEKVGLKVEDSTACIRINPDVRVGVLLDHTGRKQFSYRALQCLPNYLGFTRPRSHQNHLAGFGQVLQTKCNTLTQFGLGGKILLANLLRTFRQIDNMAIVGKRCTRFVEGNMTV